MQNTILKPSALLSLALFSYPAHAQEQGNIKPTSPPKQTQKVEIKSSSTDFDIRREDTTTKLIVTKEEIAKFGEANIVDILKRQSGIVINGNQVRMRGLGNGYTQILIDGEPMANGFSIESVNPDQVERIEISRAATADVSTQAIAGTINIILKRKVSSQQRDLKMGFNRSGKDTFLKDMRYQIADKVGNFSYNINGTVLGGFFGNDIDRDIQGKNAFNEISLHHYVKGFQSTTAPALNFNPRFVWVLDNGDTLTLKNSYFHQRVYQHSEVNWYSKPGSQVKFPKEKTQSNDDRKTVGADLQWEHKFGSGAKLVSTLGFDRFRFTNSLNSRVSQEEDLNSTSLSNQLSQFSNTRDSWKFLGNFSTAISESHMFKSGWDAGRQTNTTSKNTNYSQPENATTHVDRLALFAQDEWKTTENWSNYYGVRWESFKTQGYGNLLTNFSSTTRVVSPIVQSLWKPYGSKKNQLRFAVARTFKNPDIFDLIPNVVYQFNNGKSAPDNAANTLLKPEIALGFDGAFEHFGANRLNASFSFYQRRISNLIRRDIKLLNQRWVVMQINDGNAQTHGIEFDIKFPLSLAINTSEKIDVRGNFARNWSSVNNVPRPNNRLAAQTRFSANLGLDYVPNEEYSMGASYTFNTGGDYQFSTTNSTYSNARRTLDTYLLWRFNKDLKMRFTLGNILAQTRISKDAYVDTMGSEVNQNTQPTFTRVGLNIELKF
jgi:outer membrane receptor protein involved in Fe transport